MIPSRRCSHLLLIFVVCLLGIGTPANAFADKSTHANDPGQDQTPRGARKIVDTDGDPSTDGYYAGEAIVRLRKRLTIDAFNARHGTTLIAAIPSRHLYLVQLPRGRSATRMEQEMEA